MLRKLGNKTVITTIILVLVFAMAAWIYLELGRGGSFRENEVAKINGRSIFVMELKDDYNNIAPRYRDQRNAENNEQIEKTIWREAIREFCTRYIMVKESQKADIEVSDDAVWQYVQRHPDFLTEGKFDPYKFSRFSTAAKERLEKETSDRIRSQMLMMRVFELAKVSDIDLRIYYQQKYSKSKIRFVMARVSQPQVQDQADPLLLDTGRVNAEKKIDQFINLAKRSGNFIAAANAVGLPIQTTDFFNMFDQIKKAGTKDERLQEIEVPEIWVNAFKLNPAQISDKIMLNTGFVVIQVLARQNPDMDKFYKDLPQLKAEYEGSFRQYVWYDWINYQSRKYRLMDNIDNMFKN